MSHQTGIQANAALKQFFSKCRDGKIRVLKITIEKEELSLSKHYPPKKTWEVDFDTYLPSLIVDDMPCFILFRLDSKNSLGYEWLLLSWSPDNAVVRYKMLYASTKATLKQEFGSAHIKDEMHATLVDEVSLKGYRAHLSGVSAPAPLTNREEALKELRETDVSNDYGTDSRHSTMGGVAFPISSEAKEAMKKFSQGSHNYIQFRIELKEEAIELATASKINIEELPRLVPKDEARYHLYMFRHSYESENYDSIMFIYSMPGYNCSIRERMLYSSCKGTFLDYIEQNAGLVVAKRLEIDDGNELTKDFLFDSLHPAKTLSRPAFAKPKGPPNRGAKRITKTQTE